MLLNILNVEKRLFFGGGKKKMKHKIGGIFVCMLLLEASFFFATGTFTDQEKTITLQGTLYTGNYGDVFTSDSIWFNENAEITLPAWGYKVYETGSGITGIENHKTQPVEFNLEQNY